MVRVMVVLVVVFVQRRAGEVPAASREIFWVTSSRNSRLLQNVLKFKKLLSVNFKLSIVLQQ
jgi:hypothetical protein